MMPALSSTPWPKDFFRTDPHIALLLNIIPDAVFICDDKGKIVYANSQVTALVGYTPEEIINQAIETLVPANLRAEHVKLRDQYITHPNMRDMGRGLELYITHEHGHNIPVDISLSPLQTAGGLIVFAIVRDISVKKEAERSLTALNQQLHTLAYHDILTGIPNQLHLYDTLKNELSRAKRHHIKLWLLFIDLDHFKEINDKQGHDAGDLVLKEVASRLQSCLRQEDFIARLGGDEFAVIITDVSYEDMKRVAEKIVTQFQAAFIINNHANQVGVSIGIADNSDETISESTLLHHADSAMYMTKHSGRNSFTFYKTTD